MLYTAPVLFGSLAERVTTLFFYGDYDCKRSWFYSRSRRLIALLVKSLYNDYLCLLAPYKQQIKWKEVKDQPQNLEFCNS